VSDDSTHIESIPISQTSPVVIVDRSHLFGKPAYCLHGETFCVRCGHACWLGDKTVEAVKGGMRPLCLDCATELRADGAWADIEPDGNLGDHRRAEGPHE
jgi:hypothetical protein